MEDRGQFLATMGSTNAAAIVAWDGMTRDDLLDAMDAVLDFLEGHNKEPFMEERLSTGQDVRVRTFTMKPQLADLDLEEDA